MLFLMGMWVGLVKVNFSLFWVLTKLSSCFDNPINLQLNNVGRASVSGVCQQILSVPLRLTPLFHLSTFSSDDIPVNGNFIQLELVVS